MNQPRPFGRPWHEDVRKLREDVAELQATIRALADFEYEDLERRIRALEKRPVAAKRKRARAKPKPKLVK